jgi:hypothetical protein
MTCRVFIVAFLCIIISCSCKSSGNRQSAGKAGSEVLCYYVDNINGNDSSDGTEISPIRSIKELNRRIARIPGDICFISGQSFAGTLRLKSVEYSGKQLRIFSSAKERATIDGGEKEAIIIDSCKKILISNINLQGKGRKDGNHTNGLSFIRSSDCVAQNISSRGFQKSGIDLYDCNNVKILNSETFDNGFSGINVMGSKRELSHNITIRGCKAYNNPGDPEILDNHSGNGILTGVSDSVLIDHCTATNNGWDMPRIGNGPVGIWAWESSRVLIQYCISYRNRTSENAKDGGGFDLDGGVRNSVIQYCLSYQNEGAGYGLFQYYGASDWSDNIIRYCISVDDAATTEGSGSIFIWNGSDKAEQLQRCVIHNNLIVNPEKPLVSFEKSSKHKEFIFCNNIFLTGKETVSGVNSGSSFFADDWWNLLSNDINHKKTDPDSEVSIINSRLKAVQAKGYRLDPGLKIACLTEITDPDELQKIICLIPDQNYKLKSKGTDIKKITGLSQPAIDFSGNVIDTADIAEPGVVQLK